MALTDTIAQIPSRWKDREGQRLMYNITSDGSYIPLGLRSANHPASIFTQSLHPRLDEWSVTRGRILNAIRGRPFVELGSGVCPCYALWQYGPSEIHLVDPTPIPAHELSHPVPHPPVHEHVSHATAFLRSFDQPAIVFSAAMIQDEILDEAYTRSLAREIYRVTPRSGFTMHLSNEPFFLDSFQSAGFTLVGRLKARTWESVSASAPLTCVGSYFVLRK